MNAKDIDIPQLKFTLTQRGLAHRMMVFGGIGILAGIANHLYEAGLQKEMNTLFKEVIVEQINDSIVVK